MTYQTNSAAILQFNSRASPAPKLTGLWEAYLHAREAAERSRNIHDGIAAGRRWAAWLAAFETAQ
jgi:hypothetical protein